MVVIGLLEAEAAAPAMAARATADMTLEGMVLLETCTIDREVKRGRGVEVVVVWPCARMCRAASSWCPDKN